MGFEFGVVFWDIFFLGYWGVVVLENSVSIDIVSK